VLRRFESGSVVRHRGQVVSPAESVEGPSNKVYFWYTLSWGGLETALGLELGLDPSPVRCWMSAQSQLLYGKIHPTRSERRDFPGRDWAQFREHTSMGIFQVLESRLKTCVHTGHTNTQVTAARRSRQHAGYSGTQVTTTTCVPPAVCLCATCALLQRHEGCST
jgi:hypothetical protein